MKKTINGRKKEIELLQECNKSDKSEFVVIYGRRRVGNNEENLRNKVNAFRIETGTTNALHLTMVTTYGIKPNIHSGIVDAQVKLEDLFVE